MAITGKIKILSIIMFMAFGLNNARAQYTAPDNPIDSTAKINYYYDFVASDTLIYNVRSFDSIIVDYGRPLLRERFETIRIVCDSVNAAGHMFLSSELLKFEAYEANNEVKRQKRTESSWLNKKVFIEIDSLGKRFSTKTFEPSVPAMTVGSPFQQTIIFPLGKAYAKPKSSWMHKVNESLVENAFPVPSMNQSYLYRAQVSVDTLGYKCDRMDYILSNQGAVKVLTQGGKLTLTSVIAGFGVVDFSREYHVPVHHYSTQEIKFSIHMKDDQKRPGVQFINSFVTLAEFIPGDRPIVAEEGE